MKKFVKEKLVPFVKRALAVLGIAWLALFVFGNVGSCVVRKANAQSNESDFNHLYLDYVDFYIPSVEFLYFIPYGGSTPTVMCFGGITLRCACSDTDQDLYPEYYSFDNVSFYEFEGQINVPAFPIENGVPSVGFAGSFTLTFDFSDVNLSDLSLLRLQYYDVFYEDDCIGLDLFSPNGSALVTILGDNLYVPDYLVGSYVRFTPSIRYYRYGVVDGFDYGYEFGYDEGYLDGEDYGYELGRSDGRREGYDEGFTAGAGDPFLDLMNAVVFVPINFLWNLLNFNILGINVFMLFTAVITGVLLFALLGKVK